MKKIITLITLVSLYSQVGAQNLNTHYLYQMNWFNVNPAYTGATEEVKAIINPGTQWQGIDGKPSNSMFGVHSSMGKNMGLGGKFITDKRGLFTNLSAEMVYSYKIKLAEQHQLNFGLSMGVFQTYLNVDNIIADKYTDATDPAATAIYYNKTHLISGFGVLYTFKNLEVGASSPHMVISGRPLSDHIFGMARYNVEFQNFKTVITPSLVYQNIANSPNQLDFGLKGEWNKLAWGQVTYKSNKTIVAGIGFNINKVNVAYSYGINQSALSVISNGSHEILISFSFDKRERNTTRTLSTEKSREEGLYTSRMSSILAELKTISLETNVSEKVKSEIGQIQSELSALITKAKEGKFSSEDEKKIVQLENQISKLKSNYTN